MILNDKLGFGVNFNFYDYSLPFLSISLYGLCISNLFFMVNLKEKNKTTTSLNKPTLSWNENPAYFILPSLMASSRNSLKRTSFKCGHN